MTQYPEVEEMAAAFGFQPVRNPHPDWGISHTIRLGLEALEDCGGALFMVSDQPMLRRPSLHSQFSYQITPLFTVLYPNSRVPVNGDVI